jgi:hypothetical protein
MLAAMSDLVRLNLGCGYDVRPGWLNIDLYQRHGPDVVAVVRRLPPAGRNIRRDRGD